MGGTYVDIHECLCTSAETVSDVLWRNSKRTASIYSLPTDWLSRTKLQNIYSETFHSYWAAWKTIWLCTQFLPPYFCIVLSLSLFVWAVPGWWRKKIRGGGVWAKAVPFEQFFSVFDSASIFSSSFLRNRMPYFKHFRNNWAYCNVE